MFLPDTLPCDPPPVGGEGKGYPQTRTISRKIKAMTGFLGSLTAVIRDTLFYTPLAKKRVAGKVEPVRCNR